MNDLTGQTFGRLIVVRKIENNNKSFRYFCCCQCGREVSVKPSDLLHGRVRSCGCSHVIDIAGQRFGKLEAKNFDPYNRQKWLCRCDCGNELYIDGHSLRRGLTKSCGCMNSGEIQRKRLAQTRSRYQVDGTITCQLTSKPHKSNTSGRRGVSWNPRRQQFEAYLGFTGKKMHLGWYDDFGDAVKAREAAEEKYWSKYLDK